MRTPQQKKHCDICIIGAGPAGLAALSAIHEPYTLDSMTPQQFESANLSMKRNSHKSKKDSNRGKVGPSDKKICVVDPNCEWLGSWKDNFSRLGIKYLRSPAIAHSDHFDATALLAYAVANDREDELIESGCAEIRKLHGLGQTQVGLWKLPSTSLFEDFNANLANKLDHEYVQGTAVDITCHNDDSTNEDEDCNEGYTLTLSDGTEITCKAVVLALGPTGKPIVPSKICNVPNNQLIPWNQMKERLMPKHEVILVVGGGLTAVQAAQYSLRQGKRVYLCSRRPLVERHFDIAECWFDKRSANKHISDFYHLHQDERLAALRDVRGGGSVPPLYMNDIRKWERSGQLIIVNNVEPRYVSSNTDTNGKALISLDQLGDGEENKQRKKKNVQVEVDCVILACGLEPDCLKNELVSNIHEKFPIDIVGGFPNISVDLEWTKNLFVVGALASLNVGPDGGNIMGARRAASIVANSLECKSWLRQEEGGALSNPFEAFWDESSSDEESEVE